MAHSEHFDEVKTYYNDGRWNINRVKRAVEVKNPWIIAEEYEEITGEKYQ